jgi:hypothetical protein
MKALFVLFLLTGCGVVEENVCVPFNTGTYTLTLNCPNVVSTGTMDLTSVANFEGHCITGENCYTDIFTCCYPISKATIIVGNLDCSLNSADADTLVGTCIDGQNGDCEVSLVLQQGE